MEIYGWVTGKKIILFPPWRLRKISLTLCLLVRQKLTALGRMVTIYMSEKEEEREERKRCRGGAGAEEGEKKEEREGRGNMRACVFWGLRVWCICTRFGNTVFSVKEDVSCL